MYLLIALYVVLFVYEFVHLCIYVFVCGCVYVLMYLCIYVKPQMCICIFILVWFCVNTLVSSLIPFVINGYVNMLHLSCSLGTDGQDAILGLHACLSHRAMRNKGVIVARLIIHA